MKRDPSARAGAYVVALARGIAVLRCFDANRPELGTAEIAKMTGLPQPTVWRLANTLVALGCLFQTSGGRLRVGFGVLGLGTSALPTRTVPELVLQDMQRVADEAGAAVSLCVPDNLEMLIIQRAQSSGTLLFNYRTGSKLAIATSSSGWAYMAVAPEPQLRVLYEKLSRIHGRKWPDMVAAIEKSKQVYRAHGFILSNGTYHPSIKAVAVPIISERDGRIYTLSCGGLGPSLKLLKETIGPKLVGLAETIRSTVGDPSALSRP